VTETETTTTPEPTPTEESINAPEPGGDVESDTDEGIDPEDDGA
jgi:hypothetical protein